jgi:hypothetical protein
MKIQVVYSSETSVKLYRAMLHHTLGDIHGCKNLRSVYNVYFRCKTSEQGDTVGVSSCPRASREEAHSINTPATFIPTNHGIKRTHSFAFYVFTSDPKDRDPMDRVRGRRGLNSPYNLHSIFTSLHHKKHLCLHNRI